MKTMCNGYIKIIATATDIMYPDYRDTKLFLNILILLDDTTENGKVFQTATACEKRRVCASLGL